METVYPLYLALALAVFTVMLPLYYLRPAIQRVLEAVCRENETGAVFWLRATDVLAYSGSIMLVLMFTKFDGDLLQVTRMTILLSLAGVFVSVLFVTANVWRLVIAPARPAAAEPQAPGYARSPRV